MLVEGMITGISCQPHQLLSSWARRKSSFRHLHVIYFMLFTVLGFLSLYTSPRRPQIQRLSSIDALFNSVSALTVTGLSSVAVHRFSTNDRVTLLLLMVVGGQVFTSVIPLLIRIREWKAPASARAEAERGREMVKMEEAQEDPGVEDRIEREAVAMLSKIVPIYYVAVQAIGFIVCEIYVMSSNYAARVLKENGVNKSFFCLFSSLSSFANAGFILLDENLMPLQRASTLLVCLSILVLLGNTMFAPTLRLLTWILYRTARSKKEVYRYLLTHPRRCYTHLFPQYETWWLVSTIGVFNAAQIISMCALDWFGPAFEGLSTGYKLLDSFFQSITTRSAGMTVINLAGLASSTLFLCTGMMYVAVYPVYMTRQRSKVPAKTGDGSIANAEQEMYKQFRKLAAKDSVYVFLATFFICISERDSMQNDPLNFSVFSILFEVVSAYANVGLSLGYNCNLRPASLTSVCTNVTYSFSGKWSTIGKLLLVIVMLLGRHRCLPDDEDWAITPPIYQ